MKNKIQDLRNHLFEAIEMLKDGDLEIEKAKAVAELSQVIINSAKVEVAYLKQAGGKQSEFIPIQEPEEAPQKLSPIAGIKTHQP